MENTELKNGTEEVKVVDKKGVIIFSKPYEYECVKHNEIDLSGLEGLSTDDLLTAENLYHRAGGNAANPETTTMYSMILAHIASNKPLEFFGKLPAKEGLKIKREVYSFLFRRV